MYITSGCVPRLPGLSRQSGTVSLAFGPPFLRQSMLLPGSKFFDVRFSTCSIFEIPANPGLSVAGDFKHIVSPTHDWMKLAVLNENYNANHTLEDWRGFFCATGFVIPISTVHAIQG
jgi:hypothetical protein